MSKTITHNNISYKQIIQKQDGICNGCSFSGKLKDKTNLTACSIYGKNCITKKTGMLVWVKNDIQPPQPDETGQLSLF